MEALKIFGLVILFIFIYAMSSAAWFLIEVLAILVIFVGLAYVIVKNNETDESKF